MFHLKRWPYKLVFLRLFFLGFFASLSACQPPGSDGASPRGSVSAICVCSGMGKTGSILGRGETDTQAEESARQRCEAINSSASNCRIVDS